MPTKTPTQCETSRKSRDTQMLLATFPTASNSVQLERDRRWKQWVLQHALIMDFIWVRFSLITYNNFFPFLWGSEWSEKSNYLVHSKINLRPTEKFWSQCPAEHQTRGNQVVTSGHSTAPTPAHVMKSYLPHFSILNPCKIPSYGLHKYVWTRFSLLHSFS